MLSLKLTNFRSHKDKSLELTGKDLVIGANGSGKTSLLEAIYYLNYTKSYRTNFDQDLVNKGSDFFRLDGAFEDIDFKIAYSPKTRTKQLEINKNKLKAAEFIGNIPVVLFAPELIEIIIGSPKNRRQYIDMVIGGIDRTHINNLNLYRHLLKQRNVALQSAQSYSQLIHWDNQLIGVGRQVLDKRVAFVTFVGELINNYYAQTSNSKDFKLKIIYRGTVKQADRWQEILEENFAKDKILGLTNLGPHRDDALFLVNGRRLATTASRGEQRAFLLALKRAEIDFIKTKLKERSPLLLLDDIFSELDIERSSALFELMNSYPSITTCTDAAVISGKMKKELNVLDF